MKYFLFLFILMVFNSCGNQGDRSGEENTAGENTEEQKENNTNVDINWDVDVSVDTTSGRKEPQLKDTSYSNKAFKEVQVDKTGNNSYSVTGKARVFEGTVSYVVEDGHNVIQEGFTTASMGAPEWGDFSFDFTLEKVEPNTHPHLILFESSARDGSRTHELIIPLLRK